jgi:hypothetical protein
VEFCKTKLLKELTQSGNSSATPSAGRSPQRPQPRETVELMTAGIAVIGATRTVINLHETEEHRSSSVRFERGISPVFNQQPAQTFRVGNCREMQSRPTGIILLVYIDPRLQQCGNNGHLLRPHEQRIHKRHIALASSYRNSRRAVENFRAGSSFFTSSNKQLANITVPCRPKKQLYTHISSSFSPWCQTPILFCASRPADYHIRIKTDKTGWITQNIIAHSYHLFNKTLRFLRFYAMFSLFRMRKNPQCGTRSRQNKTGG